MTASIRPALCTWRTRIRAKIENHPIPNHRGVTSPLMASWKSSVRTFVCQTNRRCWRNCPIRRMCCPMNRIVRTVHHMLVTCFAHKCHGHIFNRKPSQRITAPLHREWSNRRDRSTNCVTMKIRHPCPCPITQWMPHKIGIRAHRKSRRKNQDPERSSSIHNVAIRSMVMTTMAVSRSSMCLIVPRSRHSLSLTFAFKAHQKNV